MRVTPGGWALLLIACLLYFFANQTQVGWLYVLCALAAGLWLGTSFVPRSTLRCLALTRRVNGSTTPTELELYAGQPAAIDLELKNSTWLPALQIRGVESCPPAPAEDREQPFFVSHIPAHASAALRYETAFARRGWVEFPPVRLTTRAPFGFFSAARDLPEPTGLLVFPEYRELKRLPLLDKLPAQQNPYPQIGLSGEFIGVRDHKPGDSRRHVHWRSTARAGRLIVKEFAEETQPGLTIALDLRAASVVGAEPDTSLELAIKIAATLARYADRSGLPVHLAANSPRWPAPPGPVSWWGLMNYLARVEADGGESFAECLSSPRPTRFLVAILTAPDEATIDPLLDVHRVGLGVLAVIVDPAPFTDVETHAAQTLAGRLASHGIEARVIGAEPDWERILESTKGHEGARR
jgi:uncharacterized protein (DUF58 family)